MFAAVGIAVQLFPHILLVLCSVGHYHDDTAEDCDPDSTYKSLVLLVFCHMHLYCAFYLGNLDIHRKPQGDTYGYHDNVAALYHNIDPYRDNIYHLHSSKDHLHTLVGTCVVLVCLCGNSNHHEDDSNHRASCCEV